MSEEQHVGVIAMATTVTISFRIEAKQLEYLKKMSHKLSLERKEDLNYCDLIREALEKTYPKGTSKCKRLSTAG